ncbi:MAG: electron transfer flavoprotein subunit alpha/FixB family protein [Candidatus Coatesbacteria bacterium]
MSPSVGVFLETSGGKPRPALAGALAAARAGGAPVTGLAYESEAEPCAALLGAHGGGRLLLLPDETPAGEWGAGRIAAFLAAAVKAEGLDWLTGLATPLGREVLPRAAALLDAPLVTDACAFDPGAGTVRQALYGGRVLADLAISARPAVVGIRPNSIPPAPAAGPVDRAAFGSAVVPDARIRLLRVDRQDRSGGPELTEARVVISGGRPMATAENFGILSECAAVLGAAVGASRAAVDAGIAPHEMQVGLTGKTVNPDLYIACGISGSVQHFAGMKTSKVIVAINNDSHAPIWAKCDYGIVADLFAAVPALTAALKSAAAGGGRT